MDQKAAVDMAPWPCSVKNTAIPSAWSASPARSIPNPWNSAAERTSQPRDQAGSFTILSESGIAAGVRRIEAATGWNSLKQARAEHDELMQLAAQLKTQPGGILAKLEALQKENRALRKDLEKSAAQAVSGQGGDLMSKVRDVNGIKVLAARLGQTNIKALRELMDDIRSKMPSGIACLVAQADENKVSMILYVSKDLMAGSRLPP